MKKTTFAITFTFIFCAFVFGQNRNCPEVSVTGPSAVVLPGETATFTASITGNADYNVKYLWSVSSGEIVEGQGTPTISVATIPSDSTPTATVEIQGLPEGCPNTDSETGISGDPPLPVKVDEFGKLSRNEEKARLSALISELKAQSESDAYIFFYHPTKNKKAFENKAARIKNFLIRDNKIPADKIHIISAGDEPEERISIFLVPQGATPPTP